MLVIWNALLILSLATSVFLGMLVYFRNSNNPINRAFAAFILAYVGWGTGIFLTRSTSSVSWGHAAFAFASLTVIALLQFVKVLPSGHWKASKRSKALLYLPGVLFFGLSFVNNLIFKGIKIVDGSINTILGPLFPLFATFFISYCILVFYTLGRAYFASTGINRMRIKYVFWGMLLFALSATVTNLILPFFKIFQFNGVGPVFSVIMVGFMAYAIIRHRLMDIRALVFKSASYAVLLAVIGGLFVVLVAYVKQGYETVVDPDVLFVLGGLVAAFGFQPIRRFLQRVTDKIFAKGRYDPEKLLGSLGDLLSSKVDLNELTESVLKTLTSEMRITRAAFVLTSDTNISDIKSSGYDREIATKPAWSAAARMVLTRRKLTVADELEEGSGERELMRILGVEVLVPLPTEDKFVGLLALGEKRSGDMYTTQDLKLLEIVAPEAAIAVQNALLFKEKEKRIQELDSLYNLALSLGSTLHLDELLEQVIDEAISVTGAETGSIMLIEEESQTLSIKVSRGIHPEIYRSTKTKIGEGIAGWVAKTSQPLVLINGQDPRFQEHLKRDEITSALTVPLKVREKVIGVLSVNRKDSKEIFTQDNLRIITSFAAQAAEAIENARLYENLEHTFLGTISALAAAVDAKDHYTYGHSEMVTDLAVETARELMLSKDEIRKIEIASKLHDIGKIGIDGSILNKPGKLTDEERKMIEEHPKIAVDILKSVAPLKEIIPLILYHHERFDGKGYPVGLSGDAIPLGARILATADSFNAMVSDRPYREALDLFTATRELQNCAGTQFDPQVVDAFLRVLEKKYTRQSEPILSTAE